MVREIQLCESRGYAGCLLVACRQYCINYLEILIADFGCCCTHMMERAIHSRHEHSIT